jgi:DNA-binding NarL/FixJ family response regulator
MLTERSEIDSDASPGVVVLSEDGTASTMNAAAAQLLDELGGDVDRNEIPLEVLAVAARLRRAQGNAARAPHLRVRTRAGRWVILHASWMGEPPSRAAAVIIEHAAPGEVLPLLLAAYGLTEQERRVTGLVCRGLSTTAIAAHLHVTTNTVQDHLKSIFTKTGIRSRRELVATLLKQQYH